MFWSWANSALIGRSLLLLAGVPALWSCATEAPDQLHPQLPAAFDNAAADGGAWPSRDWYREFGSDELDSLIDAAVGNNLDLEAARARVAQADARARQAGAAILPSIDANGSGTYFSGHSAQGSGHELDWSALVSASYEVDFWGRNRAVARSAAWLARGSRAERDTVALTMLAAVADGYFQVLAFREREAVAASNLDAARRVLDAVQRRFDAGSVGPLDVATQRAAVGEAQIAVSELQQSEREALSTLAILLGRAPESFELRGQPLESLREPPIGAGVPSQLLARRPDISLAEMNLRAANADLAAARAALFPSLSLTASGGVQSPALPAAVLTIGGAGPSLQLGASLVQPIFDHGRLEAQRDEAASRERELLSAYRASILSALRDVESALGSIRSLNEARDSQAESLVESERAFEGARLRYEAGSVDFLTLLQSQRMLYAARDRAIQYRQARLQARVGLCKALGGGWERT